MLTLDTIVAHGSYADTIVLIKDSIYIAERVTHGTSVVEQELWKTTPWRPVQPVVSLIALVSSEVHEIKKI